MSGTSGRRIAERERPLRPVARHVGALATAALVPLGLAAALVPVRDRMPNATVALALAVVVAAVASSGYRAAAALAAISASAGFDVLHTRPYGSFTITRAQDIESTVLLLTVSLLVGQLAARNRHNRRLVAETSYDLGRVHGVAEMVAAGEPTDQVVLAVTNELTDLLQLRSCTFDPEFSARPGPFVERDGALSWGAVGWSVSTTGLPGYEVSLIIQHQGRPLGRYALLPEPGTKVSRDQLVAAVALADQVGAALAARGPWGIAPTG